MKDASAMSEETPNPPKTAGDTVEFAIKLDGIKCDELKLHFVVVDGRPLIAVPDLISLLNRAVSALSVPGLFAGLLALKAEAADGQVIDAAPVEGSGLMRSEAEISAAVDALSQRYTALLHEDTQRANAGDERFAESLTAARERADAYLDALWWVLGKHTTSLLDDVKLPPA